MLAHVALSALLHGQIFKACFVALWTWDTYIPCLIMSLAADTSQLVDRHSLASKLTVTQEEFDSVQTHLMAAKEDASKSCDGCCHFKNYLAAICDQLRSVVTLAHSALQKVQEPGVLLQMPVHHKCEVNLAHMLADLSFVGGDSPQVDVAVKAAMDAIHALVAALESQHQRAVRLDVNFNRSLANSIKILSDTLSSLHSSLSEKSTGSDGNVTPSL